jgi:hypothetical protein
MIVGSIPTKNILGHKFIGLDQTNALESSPIIGIVTEVFYTVEYNDGTTGKLLYQEVPGFPGFKNEVPL